MIKLEVFDPAMCCSTGVCGPQVDPRLATFEADLRWLGSQGAEIARYNLGSEPGKFAESDLVRTLLQSGGDEVLPVVLIDGRLRWSGHYPSRDELAATLPISGEPISGEPLTGEPTPAAGGCAPESGCC